MMWKNLACGAALACAALALAGLAASAEDKKGEKDRPTLSGSWVKKEGELKVEFAEQGVLKITPHGNEDVLLVLCSYTAEKGTVKVKVTGFEGKEEVRDKVKEKLPVGSEFSFKWEVKGDTGTL